MKLLTSFLFFGSIFLIVSIGCKKETTQANNPEDIAFYPSSKPCTRWWWFATEIKELDIKSQLDWAKENNFGGVEIAWVYPLYRYERMYARNYNRHYPKDTTAQKWLSPEWSEMVAFTKSYADSIVLKSYSTELMRWIYFLNQRR